MVTDKILWVCGHRPPGAKQTAAWYQVPSDPQPLFTADLATRVRTLETILHPETI